MAGNLRVEAQERYRLIRELLLADVPPPARVVELGAAPGDQIAMLVVRLTTSSHVNQESGRTGALMVAPKRAVDTVARLRPSPGPAIVVVGERPWE